jgi:hypothetical protein
MIARFALATATLTFSACMIEQTGPTQHDSSSIDLDKAERVNAEFRMGAGTLRLSPGSDKLMRADFSYNVVSWKPYVRYSSAAGTGHLTVEQPETGSHHMGHTKYDWDIRLNKDVPMDIVAHFGAGEAHLDVGSLNLRSVEVNMGVGKLDMDLHGAPKRNYEVRIRGGVGEATVRVPSGVGVYGEAEGGLGEIRTEGLKREGTRFSNDAYEHAKANIHLDIRGGIGSIRVISD